MHLRSLYPLVAFGAACLFAQQPAYHAVATATADPAIASLPGGLVLAIPGLGSDFVISGGGQFVERANGTAHLSARVHSASSILSALVVELEFGGRVDPSAPGYPPAPPALLLQPTAYVPTGTIDPATWSFFTTVTGTLVGCQDYDGAIIDVQLAAGAAQFGLGADNRSGVLGLGAGLALTVMRQPPLSPLPPLSTAELVCELPTQAADRATHAAPDTTRTAQTLARAFALPGVADDYVFVPAGGFVEFPDGHAELTGRLARELALDDAWDCTLTLTGRVDPGDASHPPAGGPVLQMLATAYVANGGTVDPATWRHYTTLAGTLTGRGINTGGAITLATAAPFQVGCGANQCNLFFGLYGACTATVTAQPAQRTLTPTGNAEFFVVASRDPILPWPTLVVPASHPALPTLTDQGLVLDGTDLAWTELVAIGSTLVGPGGPEDWFRGWFAIVDNQHLELHPPPGLAPGTYDTSALNPSVLSNALQVDLTAPPSPALYAEADGPVAAPVHLLLHKGTATSPLTLLAVSFSNQPTVFPGTVNLAIGNGGQSLIVVAVGLPVDPVTGIARTNIGPLGPAGVGMTLHFQGLVVDLAAQVLPVPATNPWTVHY